MCQNPNTNMPTNKENKTVTYRLVAFNIYFLVPMKGEAKEYNKYRTVTLIFHPSKVMLKVFQQSILPYMEWEVPDIQAGFQKRQRHSSYCKYPLATDAHQIISEE